MTSSIDQLAVLPTRAEWVADPEVTGDDIGQVDFLIDHELAWVASDAPYVYGSTGNVLVTTFLKEGSHTFTTRVVTLDGTTATHTVRAQVQPPPPAPSVLLGGTWLRQVSGSTDPSPGQWTVTVNADGWFFGNPQGGGANQDVSYPAEGQVTFHAFIEEPRFGSYKYGGGFCNAPDPSATYAYTLGAGGRTLNFSVIGSDPCGVRQSLLEGGTWRQPLLG